MPCVDCLLLNGLKVLVVACLVWVFGSRTACGVLSGGLVPSFFLRMPAIGTAVVAAPVAIPVNPTVAMPARQVGILPGGAHRMRSRSTLSPSFLLPHLSNF